MKHPDRNACRAVVAALCIVFLAVPAALCADEEQATEHRGGGRGADRAASNAARNLAAMEEHFLAEYHSCATTEFGLRPGSGGSAGMGEELAGPQEKATEKEAGALLSGLDRKGKVHSWSFRVPDNVSLRLDSNAERDSYIVYARHHESGRVYAVDADNGELRVCENRDWIGQEGILAPPAPVRRDQDDLLGQPCGGRTFATWTKLETAAARDTGQAVEELRRKAEESGTDLLRKRAEQAATWFRKAEKGDAEAQHRLGWLYKGGRGLPQDADMAALWFRMAAAQDYPVALADLGFCYAQGSGVLKQTKTARELLRRAVAAVPEMAERGDVHAQTNLGRMYAAGAGCRDLTGNMAWRSRPDSGCLERDDELAATWFRRAAEQGHADAQARLGAKYLTGIGEQNSGQSTGKARHDDKAAAEWLRRAADQGEAGAQFMLGMLYMNGRGVPKDPRQGTEWLRRAEEQGVNGTRQAMDLLEK